MFIIWFRCNIVIWFVILKMLFMLCEMMIMVILWLVSWWIRLSMMVVWVILSVVVGLFMIMSLEFYSIVLVIVIDWC